MYFRTLASQALTRADLRSSRMATEPIRATPSDESKGEQEGLHPRWNRGERACHRPLRGDKAPLRRPACLAPPPQPVAPLPNCELPQRITHPLRRPRTRRSRRRRRNFPTPGRRPPRPRTPRPANLWRRTLVNLGNVVVTSSTSRDTSEEWPHRPMRPFGSHSCTASPPVLGPPDSPSPPTLPGMIRALPLRIGTSHPARPRPPPQAGSSPPTLALRPRALAKERTRP